MTDMHLDSSGHRHLVRVWGINLGMLLVLVHTLPRCAVLLTGIEDRLVIWVSVRTGRSAESITGHQRGARATPGCVYQ